MYDYKTVFSKFLSFIAFDKYPNVALRDVFNLWVKLLANLDLNFAIELFYFLIIAESILINAII